MKINKLHTDKEISDEISTFIDGRYISGMEAAWRLQEFPTFEEKNPSASLDNWKTTLTSWFDLNKIRNQTNLPK